MSLFQSYTLGKYTLKNRVALSPMTRGRATVDANYTFLPNELNAEYYASRASAGLVITEGVHISLKARGWVNVPGIWSEKQVAGWKKVADAIRSKGGLSCMQLWHQGRTCHSSFGNGLPWSASAVASDDLVYSPIGKLKMEVPHAMVEEEIALTVQEYVTAAKNAFAAGFDLVQIHAANGYLIQQFLADSTNKRTDGYGGSAVNRARFLKEILVALKKEVGSVDRVAIRLSPTTKYNSATDSNPIMTFSTVVEMIKEVAPNLAFLEVIEDRTDLKPDQYVAPVLRKIWKGPFMLNGNLDDKISQAHIDAGETDLVSIGRPFLANPDLIHRYKNNLPLATPDYSRLMYVDSDLAKGYTDYKPL